MKPMIMALVWGYIATAFTSSLAADPRPDDKLPVLKPKKVQYINPKWSGAGGIAFSPDGKRVAVVANGGYGPIGIFAVWDVETGKKLHEVSISEGKDERAGSIGCIAYSPDGKLIATGVTRVQRVGKKPDIRFKPALDLWDAQTGKRIRTLEGRAAGSVYAVAFSPDGKRILSGGGNATNSDDTRRLIEPDLSVWDVETGKELLDLKGHKLPVGSAKFSGDGKRIISRDVCVGPAPPFRLWDAETGKELITIKDLGDTQFRCGAINRDGTRVVTGGHKMPVQLWDADTGKKLRIYSNVPLHRVAFHPNDKWIVGVTGWMLREKLEKEALAAGTVKIWDISTGREVTSFLADRSTPSDMAISPDGKRIAVSFDLGQVSVWSLEIEP